MAIVRMLVMRLAAFAGVVVIARVMAPSEFGIFASVLFLGNLLAVLGDVGFGAAFIQQAKEPDVDDLRSAFTVQLTVSLLLVAIMMVAASWLADAYHLGAAGTAGIRLVACVVPLSALRTVPTALLERHLLYHRVALVDTAATVAFYGTVIALVVAGAGRTAFVVGPLAEACVGASVALAMRPWRPAIGIARDRLRPLVSFGAAFQAQVLVSYVKDSLTPMVVIVVAGAAAAGYVNWAYAIAMLPLLVIAPIAQVLFPAFSRLQDDPRACEMLAERAVRVAATIVLPITCVLLAASTALVDDVFGSSWEPAIPSLILFCISLWVGPVVTVAAIPLLLGTGHRRLAVRTTLLYAVLDWGIGLPLLLALGFNGIAVRTVVVSWVTAPIVLAWTRRVVRFSVMPQLWRAAVAGLGAAGVTYTATLVLPATAGRAVVAILLGSAAAMGAVWALDRSLVLTLWREVVPATTGPGVVCVELEFRSAEAVL